MTYLKGDAMFEYKFKDYPGPNFVRIGFKHTQVAKEEIIFSVIVPLIHLQLIGPLIHLQIGPLIHLQVLGLLICLHPTETFPTMHLRLSNNI